MKMSVENHVKEGLIGSRGPPSKTVPSHAVGRGRSCPLAGGKLQPLEAAAFPKPSLSVLDAFPKALTQGGARQQPQGLL